MREGEREGEKGSRSGRGDREVSLLLDERGVGYVVGSNKCDKRALCFARTSLWYEDCEGGRRADSIRLDRQEAGGTREQGFITEWEASRRAAVVVVDAWYAGLAWSGLVLGGGSQW